MEGKENILRITPKSSIEVENEEADENGQNDPIHVLNDFHKFLSIRANYHLGYPFHIKYEDSDTMAPLLQFHLNNLGDPFVDRNYGLNSKQFEVAVLDWFAELWDIPKEDYWGYITNGGTEGNLHGILIGLVSKRELHPEGVLYASQESHYSISKAARMYRIKLETVNALVTGEMDCQDLRNKLLLNRGKPAIINVNIGTTFKGGVDDIDLIIKILEECEFSEDQFYIHCDAALSGLIIPFLNDVPNKVSFKKPIGSVCVSGHKFLGCPIPCGVQITRKKHINVLSNNIDYIASKDLTISGSRNGHTPVFMWYSLKTKGHKQLETDVHECLKRACFLKDQLKEARISCMLNEFSNTVVFEKPLDDEFVLKWQLSCKGDLAHVIVMPTVTTENLKMFIDELKQSRLSWFQKGSFYPSCVEEEIGEENCDCDAHF
ncbi:hypothetical protein LIER_09478 [Lithospermum erythrorhizon]|uniref:Histidine decarboxylase n=1 Tax=Lithospermum erythrorhizon TaxID=34254 RepID=A0AAV3PK49_LITER